MQTEDAILNCCYIIILHDKSKFSFLEKQAVKMISNVSPRGKWRGWCVRWWLKHLKRKSIRLPHSHCSCGTRPSIQHVASKAFQIQQGGDLISQNKISFSLCHVMDVVAKTNCQFSPKKRAKRNAFETNLNVRHRGEKKNSPKRF